MKKLVFVLGVLAAFACGARADGIVEVSALAGFQGNVCQSCLVTFSMSYEFDVTTMAGVPNTLIFTEADNLGLGPFTPSPFQPAGTGGGEITSFLNAEGDILQISMNENGLSNGGIPSFPQVGSYSLGDLLLLCVHPGGSATCHTGFSGGFNQADVGSLTVTTVGAVATPEPGSLLLLLIGLAAVGLYARKQTGATRVVA
jgi:hypothetical protein